MDKYKILTILEIEDPELLEYEIRENDIKILYKKDKLYHALVSEDLTDVNEGSSFSSEDLSETKTEYLEL